MFGTPNEGAMQAFKFLLRGYSVGGFNIAVLNREAAFSSPAVFQLLPHQNSARFYDENLNAINIDFYNPETWKKYGWSAAHDSNFRSKFAEQPNAINKNGKKSEFADETLDELDAYFANTLKRAKLFQNSLDAEADTPAPINFFAIGSDCDNTQEGVILLQNSATKNWQTMFTPKNYKTSSGKLISAKEAQAKLYAPGDSIVTRRSLLAETVSAQNSNADPTRRNLPVSAIFSCELHNYLTNSKIFQDNVLTALMQELN